jgi:hypothetical protein
LKRAKIDSDKGTVRFTFAGSGAVSGFACEMVRPRHRGSTARKPKFGECRSPKLYGGLTPGRYTFKVEAQGVGGADPTPATRSFKIG